MINQVKNNDVLYRDLRALGYEDDEFPAWWYRPARGVAEGAQVAQKEGEVGEGGEVSTKVEREEGYDVVLPKTPAPREDKTVRPALQRPSAPSDAMQPLQTVLPPAEFSDAELSLLEDQAITEITPGRWMRTAKQAEGRIVLTPVDPRQELLNIKREAQGERIMGARVRNGTIPLFTRLQ